MNIKNETEKKNIFSFSIHNDNFGKKKNINDGYDNNDENNKNNYIIVNNNWNYNNNCNKNNNNNNNNNNKNNNTDNNNDDNKSNYDNNNKITIPIKKKKERKKYNLIFTVNENNGIGINGTIQRWFSSRIIRNTCENTPFFDDHAHQQIKNE